MKAHPHVPRPPLLLVHLVADHVLHTVRPSAAARLLLVRWSGWGTHSDLLSRRAQRLEDRERVRVVEQGRERDEGGTRDGAAWSVGEGERVASCVGGRVAEVSAGPSPKKEERRERDARRTSMWYLAFSKPSKMVKLLV